MSKDLLAVKKLLAAIIILAMLITATVDMLAYANSINSQIDQMEQTLKNGLKDEVTAVITAEPTAPAGRPFNLNIRLDLPRIMTYAYQENYPASQMFDEYKNVKVTIPLPNGIMAEDPNNMDAAKKNLVINFPKNGADDFKGQTNKGKDIKLKVLDNGSVKNGTKFTFKGAKWSFDVDMYTDKEKKSTQKVNVTGEISETSHTATAEDAWGILKNHVKTEEIGNYVVFSFEIAAGLQGAKADGSKFLYSTATERYDRYGRLNFESGTYKITDTIPELVQINRDGSKIKKNIWPDEITVVKNAVSAYDINEQTVYDSKNSTYKYTKGTTKQITFNQYNTYDPNPKTDIIGVSPQYTKYTVRLSYNKDAFLIDANEKVIQTFRITNEAKLDYQLLGEKATSDNDSDSASYVIRKGTGQIVINKYIVYPQDGKEVKRAYNEAAAKEFPMSSPLKFTLYTDSACTKIAKTVEGEEAVETYVTSRGNAVFGYMPAGTYYVKETSGAIEGFTAKQNPMQVTVPRSGGTATIEFTNVNKDFGTIAVQKVRTTKNSGIVPFGGVEFELYKNKADVNTPSKRADYTIRTENDGNGYLNKIPVGTYYAKEITPYGYEPNEEIYEVKAVADFAKFEGFKASDGKYYGTAENPIVNETNTGMLYLGVIKWDLEGMSEREINYLLPSNQIKAVSTAYAGYKLDLYYEKDGKIVRYQENGKNVTLTADENGIIKKRLPEGKYYVVANTDGYDKNKYTPWAQNHQTVDGKYCMGSFTVKVYDDNYNLPNPDSDGVIDWKNAQNYTTEYNVIHNFSGMCNMSLKKLGSGQYVVPEARFDVYKISGKGAALPAQAYKKNIATNNKAYAFFTDVEPGWYAFVETATGPQYYLPKDGIRQDIKVTKPVFDQSLLGKSGIEANKAKMIQAAQLVFFDNKLYDETPLVGLTFKKVDSKTNKQIYDGAKFNVYYIENDVDGSNGLSPTDNPEAKRVYLGVYCYKTSTSAKDRFYKTETYNGIKYNIFNAGKGAPKEKTYLVQGRDGKLVPAYGDDTTTMVGWIPYSLLGKDIKLYVEEITPPLGYDLPAKASDRIVSTTVKGGTIDETNVLVLKNEPKQATCSITVAVSNRSDAQTTNMTSADERGTYVEGSTVRLYEWNESTKKWVYVAEKNTSIDGAYITESGAAFRTEFGKTYAIAEKKTGNKNNLYYYDVKHKWLQNKSEPELAAGDGKTAGTYALKKQTTIGDWTLYGPISMPASSEKMVNYKFTFYNLPLQNVWLGKLDGETGSFITKYSGKFSIYRVPAGKSAYDDLSELEWVHTYGSNDGYQRYKGAKLEVGNYVIVETRAPSGYSNIGERVPFSIGPLIAKMSGTSYIGMLKEMKNRKIDYYKSRVSNAMDKKVLNPANGKIKGSLLGDTGESLSVSYQIDGLRLKNVENGVVYKNAVLEDSGLNYYAGQNGNGDEITLTEDDYAFTSLVINKASDTEGKFINATVEYRTAGSKEWKQAEKVKLSAQQTTVTLGKAGEKATAFRIKYDDSSIKNGFTGGEVTVNAKLNKRDILKTEEEIISVKNTGSYNFQYGIYNEKGELTYYSSEEIKEAIINLDPTDLYPQANIQKSATLLHASGNSGDIAKARDQIRYTITLTNVSTAEQNPLRNPVILDLLPDEVKTVSQGQYEKYFDITMPSGIKLAAGSGMKTIDGDTAAVLFFDGALKKNESITVSFLTKVKDDAVSIDELIRNEAAASSAIKGYAVSGNDDAASFKDSNGNWPELNKTYQAIIKNLKKNAYGYITAKADNTIERNEGLTIHKFVQGELDKNNGYQNFLSNTTPGGMVNFKVILQNTGSTPVSNIRLADLLPQPNDKGDSTSSNNPDKDRESEWTPVPQSYDFFKVSTNGKKTKLNPVIYTAEGSFDQSLRGDASAFGGKWKQDGTFREGVTAIGFDFGAETLKEGEYISLELKMTAPASGEYAGKFASNNASVYYNFADKTNLLLNSNTVHTIYHTKLVGMGGKVFLDEDMDGLYTGNEKMVSGIPVRLHVYENGKLKDTLLTETDAGGRYYFDNLFPSYVKDGKFEGYYYQYQAEFVIPKGTCLTDAYAGGSDAWKDNRLDEPGKTEAPKTIGDADYADKDREKDSNADVKTYRTELFYLNPAQEGGAIRTREGGYDLTYDAGLVRVRNIEIKKYEGSTLKPLQGAQFCLTGTGLPEAGIMVTSDAQGIVSFKNPIPGADSKLYRINYYGNYKIREVKAPNGYINQNWQTTINAGEDKTNLTYEALNEPEQLTYAVSNPKLTSLTIQKQVVNGTTADLNKDFYFTAIIEGRLYEGLYKLIGTDGTIIDKNTDAKGRIVLKHGQKAVIEGLEDGQLYIVREEKADGFTSHITKGMGTIAADAKQNVVTCTNTKESGYVRISKIYQGTSIHREASFKFNVKVDGKPYTGYYTINSTSSYTNDGVIRIKGGETAVIEAGIGQKFEIEEISYTNYTTTVTASEGIDVSGSTASGIIKETIGEVEYTNTLQTQGLLITKEISNAGQFGYIFDDMSFRFKLLINGKPYSGNYIFYPNKDSTDKPVTKYTTDGTFLLTPASAVYFDALAKGSPYEIIEIESPGNYKFTTAKVSGKVGDNNGEATVVNKLQNNKNLTIKKTVSGKSNDNTQFYFNLYLNEKKVNKISYKLYDKNGTYKDTSITNGKIVIKSGQYVLIEKIPSESTYKVVEIDVPNGYTAVRPINYKGKVDNNHITVEYKNVYDTPPDGYLMLKKKVISDIDSDHEQKYKLHLGSGNPRKVIKSEANNRDVFIIKNLRDDSERKSSGDGTFTLKDGGYTHKYDVFEIYPWEVVLIPVNKLHTGWETNCFIQFGEQNPSYMEVSTIGNNQEGGVFQDPKPAAANGKIFTVVNKRTTTEKKYILSITKKTSGAIASNASFPLKIEIKNGNSWIPFVGQARSNIRDMFEITNGLTDIQGAEKLTIEGLPANTQVRVCEIDAENVYDKVYAGFNSSDKDGGVIKIVKNTSVTITNSYSKNYVLNIFKTNIGGDADDEFTFKVYLNEKPYNGSYNIATNDTNWKAEKTSDGIIKLKGNQRAKIQNLAPNATYYVEEVENPNYVSRCTTGNASGTIIRATTDVKFENTIKNTGLSISKTTVGAEEKDAADVFKFLVTIKMPGETDYAPYVGTYSIQQDGKIGGDIQISDGIVQIKANQLALMKDIPVGSEYRIEEIAHDKYTLSKSSGTTGRITELGNLATFENTRKTAGLTIKKVQNGGAAGDIFRFKVTLNEAEYTGKYTVTDAAGKTTSTTATDGWLQLKGGQQAEITGIAIGTVYKITEEDRADYEEQIRNAAGIIEEGENKNIETFVNDKIEKALIFSKSNIGGNREDSFEFDLKVDGKAYSGEYTLTDADGNEQTLTAAGGLITLRGGQQASVKLPVGSKYTLTERNKPGYTKRIPTTSTYVDGGEAPKITVDEGKAEGTMFDGLQRIDFSNLYTEKGLLEINKIREGGSPSDLFAFNVTINDAPYSGAYQIYTEDGMLIPGEHQTEDGTITMTGGGRILIAGLNPGDKYTVTESSNPDYACDKSTQSGTIAKEGTPEEGSYSVNHVDFVNVHTIGGFSVYKNNLGGNTSDVFTFTALREVTETDGEGTNTTAFEPFTGIHYRLYQEIIGGWEPVLNGEDIYFYTDAEGKFYLTGGQKAVFEDVDTGAKIRITEADAEGYATTVRLDENSEKETGTIDFTVTGDTSHEVVYVNRIVEEDIEMPETGGTGTMIFAGFSALSAALAAICLYRRRREKAGNNIH